MESIPVEYSRGAKRLTSAEIDVDASLLDFWAWAFSDVLMNTTRGILAEFIVATALGVDTRRPRDTWAICDLEYKHHGIEVKSASYHQRWYQETTSKISFNVSKTLAWDSSTNTLEREPCRHAALYVLCLLAEKDRARVDPLDLDQWQFWVIETRFFDERKRSQHSITYNSLVKEAGEPIRFHQVKDAVDERIKDLAQPDSKRP